MKMKSRLVAALEMLARTQRQFEVAERVKTASIMVDAANILDLMHAAYAATRTRERAISEVLSAFADELPEESPSAALTSALDELERCEACFEQATMAVAQATHEERMTPELRDQLTLAEAEFRVAALVVAKTRRAESFISKPEESR